MRASALRILVAEDDEEMLELVQRVLTEEGYEVLVAATGDEAVARLAAGRFDLVLCDVRMPGADGMQVLRCAVSTGVHQPVILMSAFGTIDSAVKAMREGAYHFLAKPFDIDDLIAVVGEAAARVRELDEVHRLAGDAADPFFPIVFKSSAMGELLRMAREVAPTNATVLITGSSGTGKGLLARAMHAMSQRCEGPFVAVDCNAIPESLLESELFGHRRGAFTGAVADKPGIVEEAEGGTLFLDEVANMSPHVQAKLLRLLQERRFRRVGECREREVSVRVLSASNRDLMPLVQQGTFRDDLYYRLAVIPLRVPNLAQRRDDIAPLVYHFIRKFNADYRVEGIRQDALDLLVDYAWPGNVRQLENAVERAMILRKAGLIERRDLPEEVLQTHEGTSAPCSLEHVKLQHIQQLLRECGGNQSRAARMLGINRRTLYRKLRKQE